MVRDMAAMMTAMSGAAPAPRSHGRRPRRYASTMGVSPLEFLVLPRVLALVLMMPLLRPSRTWSNTRCGVAMLDLSAGSYMRETRYHVYPGQSVRDQGNFLRRADCNCRLPARLSVR